MDRDLNGAGLAVWIGITFFVLYYLVSLGVMRIRAEFGAPDENLTNIIETQRILATDSEVRFPFRTSYISSYKIQNFYYSIQNKTKYSSASVSYWNSI